MSEFKIGDRVRVKGESFCSESRLAGKEGIICRREMGSSEVGVRFDDNWGGHNCNGTCEEGHGRFGQVDELELLSESIIKKTMSSIIDFAKNLVLSADEKLLRKQGLKDSCGSYTTDAKELVITKLIKENEAYLLEVAKAKEEEEAKK